jgi:hypothetical protein
MCFKRFWLEKATKSIKNLVFFLTSGNEAQLLHFGMPACGKF